MAVKCVGFTDVDACDCTRGLHEDRKSLHRKLTLGKKIPGRTGDSNPRQYGALAFQSDARPTELPPPHLLINRFQSEVQILTWNPRSTQVMEVMAYV